jgi:hypothetical protein
VLTKTSAAGGAVIDEPVAKAPVKPAIDTQRKTAPAPARELTIYLDGKFVPESEAKVSVFDHGLLLDLPGHPDVEVGDDRSVA